MANSGARDLGGWGKSLSTKLTKIRQSEAVMPVKNFIAVTLLSVVLIGCGQDDRNPTENLTETSSPAPCFPVKRSPAGKPPLTKSLSSGTLGVSPTFMASATLTQSSARCTPKPKMTFIDWRQTTSTPWAGWLKRKEKHSFTGIFA